jgi:diketogulonate reductase-like aldo/keto reductase
MRVMSSRVESRSRRDVLCAGVSAAAALLVRRQAWAAPEPQLPLITRTIPASGEKLPAIGLGTDKFRSDDRSAIQAEIQRMQQLGGTVIDTAAAYGDSEALIGEALTALGSGERLFIATKLTGSDRDGAGGEASFARSLTRLRRRRVDLLQVHNLDGVDALMPLLQR